MQTSVCDWLEEIEKKFPTNVAYYDDDTLITFKRLKYRAIAVASRLVGYEHSPIAVAMKKGVDELVAFWGVAYSGNFYSPIDVDMPLERIRYIFDTLQPRAVVTTYDYGGMIRSEFPQCEVIVYESILDENVKYDCVNDRMNQIIDSDLLYVLFTSGSTGVPKGVCVTHKNVINYIDNIQNIFGFTENNNFGNQAPFYFDHSLMDIYMPVKTGCMCGIIPKELFSQPVRLLDYIINKHIDTLFWVPSALVMVSRFNAFKNRLIKGCIKYVISGGDVLPIKELNKWKRAVPDAVFANLYGPTETTGDVTYYIIRREFAEGETIPLGGIMDNNRYVIINDDGKEVPNGEIGELCIYGAQVSNGYYNNPELTRERFCYLSISNEKRKVYKTGDLVRLNERREIIFVSRKDNQIKHMGHRIELGEIESVATSIDGMSQCVSVYDKDRDRIILFIDVDLDTRYIMSILKKKIPEYMTPHVILYIKEFPLNQNGKIDRKKLLDEYMEDSRCKENK